MICSSLNLLRFIRPLPFSGPDATSQWRRSKRAQASSVKQPCLLRPLCWRVNSLTMVERFTERRLQLPCRQSKSVPLRRFANVDLPNGSASQSNTCLAHLLSSACAVSFAKWAAAHSRALSQYIRRSCSDEASLMTSNANLST